MAEVGKALYRVGCKDFFVAYAEEGVALRVALQDYDVNIYVLHGMNEGSEDIFAEYNLTATINNEDQLKFWNKIKLDTNCIIHIETGLNRFAFPLNEFAKLKEMPHNLEYIISHLACDDEKDNAYNTKQLDLFKKYTDKLGVKRSLVASGGSYLGPEYHFDMIRAGGLLYGTGHVDDPAIKNPVTLTSPIMNIIKCSEDLCVGYGANYKVSKGSKIAVIPIGYGDGLPRKMKENGFVFIKDQRVPIAKSISMDLTVIDVTGIDCKVGDDVEVIGPNNTPLIVGSYAGTLGYEIIAGLKSKRFDRVYVKR
jgi:alanine racemase